MGDLRRSSARPSTYGPAGIFRVSAASRRWRWEKLDPRRIHCHSTDPSVPGVRCVPAAPFRCVFPGPIIDHRLPRSRLATIPAATVSSSLSVAADSPFCPFRSRLYLKLSSSHNSSPNRTHVSPPLVHLFLARHPLSIHLAHYDPPWISRRASSASITARIRKITPKRSRIHNLSSPCWEPLDRSASSPCCPIWHR
ncbi:hypothetical protein B0H16DRAFT_1530720 [Mycena metata]|uniref:Uncharacterized protein n=1 Tax=Mycena metata TaxID=1033252 RepID=A0AAD7NIV2_9AGAR|nr:hypothetical protein B0H16DRAFT_1530720 [Mycena metata]